MNFDWDKIEESKRLMRRDLASRPIAEKLRLLDAMRERELGIRGGRDRTLPQGLPADAAEDSGCTQLEAACLTEPNQNDAVLGEEGEGAGG